MDFEFDPTKSEANKRKHGIDFDEAKALWKDDNRFELPLPSDDETRCIVVAMIGERYWTAIITYRAERVRLISVRRARDVEIVCYEG